MKTRTFRVVPKIPDQLTSLKQIAYNTWWTWNPQAIELFRWIDSDLWEKSYHNPVRLLGHVSQERLKELAHDSVYISHLEKTTERLTNYLERSTWFDALKKQNEIIDNNFLVATFSAEFGLHESIPIYSGGLGVLAGDTIKSGSELGLPMVGISLLYRHGYFSQYLNSDGWQQERYFINDYSNMPVEPVFGNDGSQVSVDVPMGNRIVKAAVWKIKVGRADLFLLDTNLPENRKNDREITGQLYGGNQNMRIKQEIVLGIGGLRALDEMNLTPTVRHINEGHSAFLIVELIRKLMKENLSFPEARELVSAGNVFTTHTPVPAGNEEFPPDLVIKYLHPMIKEMGLTNEDFLQFGYHDDNPNFSMTVFGLRFCNFRNGVSELHGRISRKIWKDVWPTLPEADTPITHVTNGIHPESWVSDEMAKLFSRYVGPRWSSNKTDSAAWKKIDKVPDSELWPAHIRMRERLVSWSRDRWENQIKRMGLLKPHLEDIPVLDPETLTIGFARRFASYKRATLLLRDEERLNHIVNDHEKPVQFIFAGKAHPHDTEGKELIRKIVHLCMKEEFYGKIIYLEDFSIEVARQMVQGVDVWLNTPKLPMEASGTSGMKACFNGVIQCSVPDGWWAEAYEPGMGWSIGKGEEYDDPDLQDRLEAKALYNLIENQISPIFYDRDKNDIPVNWIRIMKESMKKVCPFFSSNRMLTEYTNTSYVPAYEHVKKLSDNDYSGARDLAEWMEKVRKAWGAIQIEQVECDMENGTCAVGDPLPVIVTVHAPDLLPEDLQVEIHHGKVEPDGWLTERNLILLKFDQEEDGNFIFTGSFVCNHSGNQGFTARILPCHPEFGRIIEPGLVCWWD
ncbi:MAG: alpha-glucan family phosphorylase [Candidatus Aegiribacteria sp.]|nr:alpha-glucan family phosphorylase [Candidatus Aegiribacteria sp.]